MPGADLGDAPRVGRPRRTHALFVPPAHEAVGKLTVRHRRDPDAPHLLHEVLLVEELFEAEGVVPPVVHQQLGDDQRRVQVVGGGGALGNLHPLLVDAAVAPRQHEALRCHCRLAPRQGHLLGARRHLCVGTRGHVVERSGEDGPNRLIAGRTLRQGDDSHHDGRLKYSQQHAANGTGTFFFLGGWGGACVLVTVAFQPTWVCCCCCCVLRQPAEPDQDEVCRGERILNRQKIRAQKRQVLEKGRRGPPQQPRGRSYKRQGAS